MKTLKSIALAVVISLTACAGALPPPPNPVADAQQRLLNQAQATYEEKCRTLAGEKIYKTVQDVDGLLLMKVRPARGAKEWADLMWPGAAFARESTADEYITTFLGYEFGVGDPRTGKPMRVSPRSRGYISSSFGDGAIPGYRWVEAIDPKDAQRYRYRGSEKVVGKKDITAPNVQAALKANPNYDLNVYRWVLEKSAAVGPMPRYGVTYEDHVIPEDRALGIASSTVKVIDLKTQEVLGEMTRYAWTRGGASTANPSPWLTAYRCPDHAVGTDAATRKFVDQILIPRQEK